MPTFKLISSDVRPLTVELAQRFRDMAASPTERRLDPKRVKYLREKIVAGHAIPFNWATARLGDQLYRMNGQHSSSMLAELNGEFPDGLKVHWDEYTVENGDGLAMLFRQFDDRKSGRSPGDVAGAYQGLYPDLADVDRNIGKMAVEGVWWWRKHVEAVPVPSGDDAYTLFGEDQVRKFALWVNAVLSIKTPELKRQAVVAAMYATHNANPEVADKFWTEVARGGIETEENHPSTVLDSWLKAAKEDVDLRDRLKPGNYYQGCLFAWNAQREGKSLKDIKHDTRKGFYPATS